ncbi:endonuclease/exonuclease/phosphatase family protein [Actinomadura flavalba]|uniref:endonuclease/exonuclease/phosphatase family protein n=1 Tax=Actinomadura flavalba TaxID=1120938 RepID=UPI000361073F|nr:endonuclease/exonuclease/phosphatase family protein [Actinomadura flavalba]
MSPLRLVSYNVRSLRDDAAAVAAVVRALAPDVLCLQEVPRFGRWRWRRRALARACGMRIVAGRRACGLAVFAAPGVRPVGREFHLLAKVPGLHRRGLAVAALELPDGARFTAASTHLDLRPEPRLAHVREVLPLLARFGARHGPVVLAGDINEEPGGPSWTLLSTDLRDAHAVAPCGEAATFPAANPHRRIDGVFTDPSITVEGCGVPPAPSLVALYPAATDHRPLVADLRLPG